MIQKYQISYILLLFLIRECLSLSPLERSNEFISNWNSKKCQDYQNKGFFVTSENIRSCSNTNKDRRCPRLFRWPEFPQLHNGISPCLIDEPHIDRRDVMVSHQHKFIYVNVPKVGTQTIKELLSREFKLNDQRGSFDAFTSDPTKNYDEYFVFTFVRDPLTRMESAIGQARLFMVREEPLKILDLMSQGCIVEQHVITQSKFLKVYNPFTKKEIDFSFIGSLENINDDIEFLLPILKAPPKDRMTIMNILTLAKTRAAKLQKQSKNKVKNLSKLEGSPLIRHKNKGKDHFHKMFDYTDLDTSKKMMSVLEHDYACFPTYTNILE